MTPLRAVAAYGLPGARPIASEPCERGAWDALLEGVAHQRLTGELVAAIADGALAVTDAQWLDACDAHREALALDVVLDRLLVDTATRFRSAGIAYRALKGAALAHTVYPEPEWRSYGDVDILVESARYDDAIAQLVDAGGRARYAEPRPGFTKRFGKGVCVVTAAGLEIDVHRSFVAGPFGLALDVDDLFVAPTVVTIAGVAVDALAPVPRFMHACFHASLGDKLPRLAPLRDVAQIMLTTDLDVDAVLHHTRRWRAGAIVQHAVRTTWQHLDLAAPHPLVEWAAGYEPDRFERGALRSYIADDRSYATQAAAGIRALHGTRARAAYARALLWPSRDYARERGGYVARLRRSARLARGWKTPA